MKKYFLFSVFAVFLAIASSCSRSESEDVVLKTRMEAMIAMYPRVCLDAADSVYYLDLSREEAAALGISEEFYEEALQSIEAANDFIRQIRKEDPDARLNLDLPPAEALQTRFDVLPRDPNNPKSLLGLQTDYNHEEASRSCVVSASTTGLKFYCLGKSALVCTHVCKTYSMGTWATESAPGSC